MIILRYGLMDPEKVAALGLELQHQRGCCLAVLAGAHMLHMLHVDGRHKLCNRNRNQSQQHTREEHGATPTEGLHLSHSVKQS